MSDDDSAIDVRRRTVLKASGVVAGVGLLGTRGGALSGNGSEAPATEWKRSYSGDRERDELSLRYIEQTEDGGYVLAGTGSPITKTGPEPKQFAVLKADTNGDRQWLTFFNDDNEETEEIDVSDVTQTGDGGYAVVGWADVPENYETDLRNGLVAEAVKLNADGDVEWLKTFDAFESNEETDGVSSDAGSADNALFTAVAPTPDGGFVASGRFENAAWLVKFAANGSVLWDRSWTVDSDDEYRVATIQDVQPRADGGSLLYTTRVSGQYNDKFAVYVDESGAVERRVKLNVDYSKTPYNHSFLRTTDGGYAYTGRDQGRENMVLGKLSAAGEPEWRKEYNGPYDGTDWADHVVQTTDGGFALAGYMTEGYSGDYAPTVLKTNADGTEVWRRLFTNSPESDVQDFIETADSGYAFLVHGNTLRKLAPDASEGDGTDTPEEATETPEGDKDTPNEATDTPNEATDTPRSATETPRSATETPDPSTDTPTAGTDRPSTETPTPDAPTKTPTDGTATPDVGTETQTVGTRTPRTATSTRADGTATPNDGTATPAAGTDTRSPTARNDRSGSWFDIVARLIRSLFSALGL